MRKTKAENMDLSPYRPRGRSQLCSVPGFAAIPMAGGGGPSGSPRAGGSAGRLHNRTAVLFEKRPPPVPAQFNEERVGRAGNFHFEAGGICTEVLPGRVQPGRGWAKLLAGDHLDAVPAGHGPIAETLGAEKRAQWRARALAWMGEELAAWRQTLDDDRRWFLAEAVRQAHGRWDHPTVWHLDPVMAIVVRPQVSSDTPVAETDAWEALFADVQVLVRKSVSIEKRD